MAPLGFWRSVQNDYRNFGASRWKGKAFTSPLVEGFPGTRAPPPSSRLHLHAGLGWDVKKIHGLASGGDAGRGQGAAHHCQGPGGVLLKPKARTALLGNEKAASSLYD